MRKLFTLAFLVISSIVFANGYNNKLSINTFNFINEINNENSSLLKSSKDRCSEIGAYIIVEEGCNPYSLEEYGVKVNMVLDSIISARIPLDAIDKISSLDIKFTSF